MGRAEPAVLNLTPTNALSNVDYCSGQSLPNCRGWAKYFVSPADGGAPITLSHAFPKWWSAATANWAATERAFGAAAASAASFVPRAARAALTAGQDVDPLTYPMNPSCYYPPG